MGGKARVPYADWVADSSAAIAKWLPKGTTPVRMCLPGDSGGDAVIVEYEDVPAAPAVAVPPAPPAKEAVESEEPGKPKDKEEKKVTTEEYLKSKQRGRGRG